MQERREKARWMKGQDCDFLGLRELSSVKVKEPRHGEDNLG